MDTISSLWDILNDINVNNISGVVVISKLSPLSRTF